MKQFSSTHKNIREVSKELTRLLKEARKTHKTGQWAILFQLHDDHLYDEKYRLIGSVANEEERIRIHQVIMELLSENES